MRAKMLGVLGAGDGAARRLVRAWNQWLDGDDERVTSAVFVLGSPHDGTHRVFRWLAEAPQLWGYGPQSRLAHDEAGRLRAPATIAALLRLTPADRVVFEPLHDSHLADRLLALHPDARAVWVYRPWREAAAEGAARDGEALREAAAALARGDTDVLGWRGERLPAALLAQVHDLGPLDATGAAALDWYLRHSVLAALGLEADPRVLRLDATVLDEAPDAVAGELASFLGLAARPGPLPPAPAAPRRAEGVVPPRLAGLCDALQHHLETSPSGGFTG